MFKIFKVIDDFILDIYDCRLLDEPLNAKIEELKIAEISNAYDTMMNIIRAKRKPYSAEFMKDIYPILEIAVIWDSLKKEKIMDKDFFTKLRTGCIT